MIGTVNNQNINRYTNYSATSNTQANINTPPQQGQQAAALTLSATAQTMISSPASSNNILDADSVTRRALEIRQTTAIEAEGRPTAFSFVGAKSGEDAWFIFARFFRDMGLDSSDVGRLNLEVVNGLRGNETERLAAINFMTHLAVNHFDNEEDAAMLLANVHAEAENWRIVEAGWIPGQRSDSGFVSPSMRFQESWNGSVVSTFASDGTSVDTTEVTTEDRQAWERTFNRMERERIRIFGETPTLRFDQNFRADIVSMLFNAGREDTADWMTNMFNMLDSSQ